MANGQDDLRKYVMDTIKETRATGYGRELAGKNATDLHILVAVQNDPRPISAGLKYSNLADFLNDQDADGMTALMYAAKEMNGGIAKELVDAGADKTLKNNDGQTALQLFNDAYNEDQEAIDADIVDRVRAHFEGGRRRRNRKTRARKTKRRLTRRRK